VCASRFQLDYMRRALRRIGFSISQAILFVLHAGRYILLRLFGSKKQMHGVRVILERDGRVVLVRHWFAPWVWTLPGGGVEGGESVESAAIREVREETGYVIKAFDGEIGTYEGKLGKHDVVKVLCTTHYDGSLKFIPNAEIMMRGLFATDNLPENTSPANRRRIEAYTSGVRNEKTGW